MSISDDDYNSDDWGVLLGYDANRKVLGYQHGDRSGSEETAITTPEAVMDSVGEIADGAAIYPDDFIVNGEWDYRKLAAFYGLKGDAYEYPEKKAPTQPDPKPRIEWTKRGKRSR